MDDAARARGYSALCLKILASMSCDSPYEHIREESQRELSGWLVQLRALIAAPETPESLRAEAIATLNAFWSG
jgi:hypothetical protein